MNILLTGSGGFIGKNLKEYLKCPRKFCDKPNEVRCEQNFGVVTLKGEQQVGLRGARRAGCDTRLDNKYTLLTPRSYELNLIDEQAVKDYFSNNNIDFVIHCGSTGGARGIQDRDTTIEDNLAMVDNILKYKKENTRVILFGSGAMYGKSRNLHKVKEEEIGSFIPEDLYGKSKMLIAQKIKDRKDVLCLNIFACYGYGEKENRFPSYAINCVLENKTIEINQNCVFDYLFVEDMQRIIYYFIEHKPLNNIINITPTNSISLYEIAQIVSDGRVDITIKNPVLNNEYTGDNTRLLNNIKGFEFTPIETGLGKLLNYKKGILV